jgi:hypothetical protein
MHFMFRGEPRLIGLSRKLHGRITDAARKVGRHGSKERVVSGRGQQTVGTVNGKSMGKRSR